MFKISYRLDFLNNVSFVNAHHFCKQPLTNTAPGLWFICSHSPLQDIRQQPLHGNTHELHMPHKRQPHLWFQKDQ